MALQHLRSNTASKRPTPGSMSDGQLAINTNATSPGLFFKDAGGALIKVGPVHVGTSAPNSVPAGSSGNAVGEQWLDTSGGGYVLKIWDGTAWRSETGQFVDVAGDTMTGNLTISGADLIMSNGEIVAETGSAATPSITFTGDTNTGLYSPGANQVALSTNGTGRLFVDASGNVGLSEAAPSARLHIAGTTTAGGIKIVDSNESSAAPGIVVIGKRSDANVSTCFGGKVLLSKNRTDAAIQATNQLGSIAFGGNHTDGSEANILYAASVIGEADGLFNSAADMPTALVFRTGSVGRAPDTPNVDTGSERLRITSDAKVGIGTSSPTSKLYVSGPISAPSLTFNTDEILTLRGGTVSGSFGVDNSSPFGFYIQAKINTPDSRPLLLNPAGGNVGIGTTSPTNDFVVSNGGAAGFEVNPTVGVGVLYYNRSTSQYVDATHDCNQFIVTRSSSERFRCDSSGRLLVGTSSSTTIGAYTNSLLQVKQKNSSTQAGLSITAEGSSGTTFPRLLLSRSNTGATAVADNSTLGVIQYAGYDSAGNYIPAAWIQASVDGTPGANDMPGRLVFSVTADGSALPSEAMRINNAGELLVGYTSDNGAYKLQVNSQIFATSATIATSDGRYKENVASLDGCVDLVKALRPVSFDWKAQEPVTRVDEDGETVVVREAHNFPDGKQVGFIAQEVEAVLADKPWLGSVIKQNVRPAVTDADGNELAPEEEFLGIAEGNLVAVLTSALKDAIGRIEILEAEVAALKA